MKGNGILIVEDDRDASGLLARMISRRYPATSVYSAANGRKGLEAFLQFFPEVVITDITMPEMNGLQMAHRIGALSPETRLIAMSANLERLTTSSGIRPVSFDHYFTKPVNLSDIFSALNDILQK
ncbi:response regulator transcription factor [Geomesophilobacter sediminis]|uniref:Response regulator n=1 Tax=Geomesophilobacter sediminis TaxID=2798584 RepID=A0A8J7JER5_9BACT|nr:response regulator [Geomesophilobacter sediminis]MBJ6726218.1 response regulator [Geomesophilobacter sediminis]